MSKLIMLKGLPGAGKTYWAQERVQKGAKRLSLAEIMEIIPAEHWAREALRSNIAHFSKKGFDVIIDDRNLEDWCEQHYRNAASELHIDFEIKSFTRIGVRNCIANDLKRANSVGSKVIRAMYNKYLSFYDDPLSSYTPGLPEAIICDIDGTLARHHRDPLDYANLHTDSLIEPVRKALYRLSRKNHFELEDIPVFIVSGRPETHKSQTVAWLEKYEIPYDEIYLRAEGDEREDSEVKKELYREEIQPRYNVKYVLDDRDRVVDMWRSLGLVCFQVADGDF